MTQARLQIFLFAGALVLGANAAAAEPCLSDSADKQWVSGRLSIERVKDAAGRLVWHYLLTLGKPVCLATEDPADQVQATRSIHIVSSNLALTARLARHVDTAITVRGQPYAGLTSDHYAPIVMDINDMSVP